MGPSGQGWGVGGREESDVTQHRRAGPTGTVPGGAV
jgi:hypothetical protein